MAETALEQELALAIDIGGAKIALGLVDGRGKLLWPIEKRPVPFGRDGAADPAEIIETIAPSVERARRTPGFLRGIGLSLCGNVDPKTGMAVLTPNLHWRYLPFAQMVRQAFGLPVFAAIDVRMAVLGEAMWGKAAGVRDFAWATVGTGFGGYLFLDGKPYDGVHGFGGNFGHITLDEVHGELCGCGRRGCFETYVAGPGIARQGQAAAERGESPPLQEIARQRPITTRDVFAAEAASDPAAHQIIESAIRLIAINLGGLVNVLDITLIVMGGGVVNGAPDFAPRIDRRVRDFLMTEEAVRELRVVKETFPNSALIGAAVEVFLRQGVLRLSAAAEARE